MCRMNMESRESVSGVETIRNAAVRYQGKIFEGVTHGHAFGSLLEYLHVEDPALYAKVHGDEYELVAELEQLPHDQFDFEGFVTSSGRYVPRAEATEIARRNRQLTRDKAAGADLYSEDLRG